MNKYKKALKEIRGFSEKLSKLVSEASNKASLLNKETKKHSQTIWNTGAYVIGPVFFLFVKWALEKAVENGFHRLYFFARDGQLLKEIAKIISKKYGYNIQCRYLYGSRQALLLPALQKIGDAELKWLFRSTLEDLDITEIFNRLNLKPEIISEELKACHLPESIWDKPIHWEIQKKLSECLKNPKIMEKILQNAGEYRKTAIGYFRQEGLFDDGKFAIVDIGWTGSSLKAMYRFLHSDGWDFSEGLPGLFFSLQTKDSYPNTLIPYFNVLHSRNRMKRLMNRVLLEVFAQADHGMTLSYKKNPGKSGRYEPVLSDIGVRSSLEWGVKLQQQSAIEFARCFTELYPDKNLFSEDGIDIVKKLLMMFLEKPTLEESTAYGKCIFAEEQTEKDMSEVAPAISKKDFFLWLIGVKPLKKNFFYWVPASLKRSHIRPIKFFVFIIPWRIGIARYCMHIFLTIKVALIRLTKRLFPGFVEKLKAKKKGY